MAGEPDTQPRRITVLDLLALIGAVGIFVAILNAGLRGGGSLGVGIGLVVGLALLPVAFVGGWFLLVGVIVACLWLFSVDRDLPTAERLTDPIFPAHWWDFRPILAISVLGVLWVAFGIPALRGLTWSQREAWPLVIGIGNLAPAVLIAIAARRWWPAWATRIAHRPLAEGQPATPQPPDDGINPRPDQVV